MGRQCKFVKARMTKDEFFYAYQELACGADRHILLESGRDGRLCIAGINPLLTMQAPVGGPLEIIYADGRSETAKGEPLQEVVRLTEQMDVELAEGLPAFQGGALGFISYDYMRRYEPVQALAADDLETPDLHFYLFEEWAVLDVAEETAFFMALPGSDKNPAHMRGSWERASCSGLASRRFDSAERAVVVQPEEEVAVSVTGPEFEEMVRAVQRYIRRGDVEQVNLSVRQSAPLRAEPLRMYEALRAVNPSPYMAMIGAPDFSVVSGSPELLLKKRGDSISTRPIGGTRLRGKDQAEDRLLEDELLASQKDREEHDMLVEVELDDFRKICREGTVDTDEYRVIEKYSHVMHLVSNITGDVLPELTTADVIRGVFPGGSITGGPKLRTMELIEQLEPVRRGLYTGSIGWIGCTGDLELNVVIRTAYMTRGTVHIQAGAGLTADSVPRLEYEESLNKANALWQAKQLAERPV